MALGIKSFIINRTTDWEILGKKYNLKCEKNKLVTSLESAENGYYFSRAFDSLELETVWHRLKLFLDKPEEVKLNLRVFASDKKIFSIINLSSKFNLEEILTGDKFSPEEKNAILEELGAKKYENPDDILLYSCKGRFLWFSLEIIKYNIKKVRVKELKIEFPRYTLTQYLPEFFVKDQPQDSFLERFLAIFNSINLDLEDRIENLPSMFDPYSIDSNFLSWFSKWFSIQDELIWGEEKLRKLISEIVKLYRMKGTKYAISRIIEIYTGEEPIIIEKFNIENNLYYLKNKKKTDMLFGDNSYYFTIIINNGKINTPEEYTGLLMIIDRFKPIDSICNLVVLNKDIYLDHHCYLGLNSRVAEKDRVVLDEQRAIYGSNFLLNFSGIK